MIISFMVACSLGVITTGCSTLPFAKQDENKMVEVPKGKLDNIPEWFLVKDAEDKKFITVTATDVSKDMQFAIDKATLNAKIQIGERLRTDIESVTRESALESGVGVKDVEREVDRVSKVKIKQAIGFFKREHIAVIREGENYRAFVMFKIAIEDARRLTAPDNKKSRDERFKELEAEENKPQPVASAVVEIKPVQ
jgi:hypothetical protein